MVLALLAAVAAVVAGVVVARHRRAAVRDWENALARAATDATNLARDLGPSLLAGSRESRRGGWEVARPQVVALEDQIARLSRAAPNEQRAASAEALRSAVADARRALDAEMHAADEEAPASLVTARQALARLEDRLAAMATGSPTDVPG